MTAKLINTAILLFLLVGVSWAFTVGLDKEIRRQDIACKTMQRNGYLVECK